MILSPQKCAKNRKNGSYTRACLKNMDQLCYFNKMAIEAI